MLTTTETVEEIYITKQVAIKLSYLLNSLLHRGEKNNYQKYTPPQARKFVLQCVMIMYFEDLAAIFKLCLQECLAANFKNCELLNRLFTNSNYQYITAKYLKISFLKKIHPIKLEYEELQLLQDCVDQDWRKIRPFIFGNLFEGALKYTDQSQEKTKKQRHAQGIHFTTEGDIKSIVFPTIREYWEDKINQANSLEELENLHEELVNYKVLDPACGSGNFLYVAYQELKYIEKILLEKMTDQSVIAERNTNINISNTPNIITAEAISSKDEIASGGMSVISSDLTANNPPHNDRKRGMKRVSIKQFYGIDINAFAVELAKVTLMIGHKIVVDKLGLNEPSLPLEQLDDNIICADALFTNWIKADAIIGNPPFLGSKHIRLTLGDEYVNQLFAKFPDLKDVDFCAYWFRIAHQQLPEKGRAGLVATNSISQGKSRKVSLDYIIGNQGYIYNAISSQKWSEDAAVHVSIVNWCKIKPDHFILDSQQVSFINSSLTSSIDVTQAVKLKANLNQCFQGVIPLGKAFYISEQLALEWIKKDPKNQDILKPCPSAIDLTKKPLGKSQRWIIDFQEKSLEDANNYPLLLTYIKENVKLERERNRAKRARNFWWQLFAPRPAMRQAIANLAYYFVTPRHSKWFIFIPNQSIYLPSDSTNIVATEDYYILGILTSNIHRIWVKAQSSTLEDSTRYTNTTCFETFPFPQNPNQNIVKNIRETMIKLHQYRSKEMSQKGWGITQLYNEYFNELTSKLSKFHQQLDQLVISAYHFQENDDILENLLLLNYELAEKEQNGEVVIGAKDPYLKWVIDN